MRFCSTRSMVGALALWLAACGGAATTTTTTTTTPRATTAPTLVASSPRLLPATRDTFVRVSIAAIARTPIADRVIPGLARLMGGGGLPIDPTVLSTFLGTTRGGVLHSVMVFDPRGPTARDWLQQMAEANDEPIEWLAQPVPHFVAEDDEGTTAFSLVAPRALYIAPADEVSALRPLEASDPDLAAPPGELVRIESASAPPAVGHMFAGVNAFVLSAYDTGNSVRVVLELSFATPRAAEEQAEFVRSTISAAQLEQADQPLSPVFANATLTRAGTRSTLVLTFSYEIAGLLLDMFAQSE